MLCCNQDLKELQRTQQPMHHPQTKQKQQLFFEPCSVYNHPIEFICLDPQCRDSKNTLLCNFCLNKHKQHNWVTKEDFLTNNIRNILLNGKAESDERLNFAQKIIEDELASVEQAVKDSIVKIKMQFQQSISYMKKKYKVESIESLTSQKNIIKKAAINSHIAQKLIRIYEIQQKNYDWINVMQNFTVKMIDQIKDSFKALLNDASNVLNAQKWQDRQNFIDQFNQFHSHLHKHDNFDARNFTFSNKDKHNNITLDKTLTEATYMREVPSKPVVMTNEYITEMKNRFGFQILKMEGFTMFFPSTTVFVGVCNSSIAKSVGLRKINELGKGAYMISSSGWSYHSENQLYNNKQLVGWGFGQDDKITVQVVFDSECKIIFSKENRFFSNRYQMPLGLNQFQAKRLRPCVSFDSQEGAIVKIFDISSRQQF